MKNTFEQLKKVAIISGLLVGSFALSGLAADGSWLAPTCPPPDCNAAAPLNVTSVSQEKLGRLLINTGNSSGDGLGVWGKTNLWNNLSVYGESTFGGNVTIGTFQTPARLKLVDGNQRDNYYLKTDALGNATWAPLYIAPPTAPIPNVSVTTREYQVITLTDRPYPQITTPTRHHYCGLTAVNIPGDSDNWNHYCRIRKNNDGTWTLGGIGTDGPTAYCAMTCMDITLSN